MEKWIARNFKVISKEQCIEWGLAFLHNIHGDEINHLGCRSIWVDLEGREYRCSDYIE